MRRAGLALALVALLAGGCAAPGPSQEDGRPTAVLQRPADLFEGTDCVGSDASTPGPGGGYGESPPPGWEASLPLTFVSETLRRCERIAWGPLQRPAFLIWELHESFDVPATCTHDGEFNRIVGAVWSNDTLLVERAKAFGLPAFLAEASLERPSTAGAQAWTWRWGEPGGEASSLAFSDNPPDAPVLSAFPMRYFWLNGTGVSSFGHTSTEGRNQAADPLAVGTFASPTFYARGGNPAFAGTAVVLHSASFSGRIEQFADLQCLQPK